MYSKHKASNCMCAGVKLSTSLRAAGACRMSSSTHTAAEGQMTAKCPPALLPLSCHIIGAHGIWFCCCCFSFSHVNCTYCCIYEFIFIWLPAGICWGCIQVRIITKKTSVNIQRTGESYVKNISNFIRNCQIGLLKVPVLFYRSASNWEFRYFYIFSNTWYFQLF